MHASLVSCFFCFPFFYFFFFFPFCPRLFASACRPCSLPRSKAPREPICAAAAHPCHRQVCAGDGVDGAACGRQVWRREQRLYRVWRAAWRRHLRRERAVKGARV
eukprot:365721-Chlamydomonas_euryale.AAC.21